MYILTFWMNEPVSYKDKGFSDWMNELAGRKIYVSLAEWASERDKKTMIIETEWVSEQVENNMHHQAEWATDQAEKCTSWHSE